MEEIIIMQQGMLYISSAHETTLSATLYMYRKFHNRAQLPICVRVAAYTCACTCMILPIGLQSLHVLQYIRTYNIMDYMLLKIR